MAYESDIRAGYLGAQDEDGPEDGRIWPIGEPYPESGAAHTAILPGHEDATDPDPYADSRALGALVADVRYALAAIRVGDREEAQEVLERALARHPEIDEELQKS